MEKQELLQDENRCQPLTACWDLPVWVESREEYLWENEVNMNMLTDGKPLLFWLLWCTHELSALSVTICTSLYIHGGPWCCARQDLEQFSVATVGNVRSQIIRMSLKTEVLKVESHLWTWEWWDRRNEKKSKKAGPVIMFMVIVCVSLKQALAHQGFWLKAWQRQGS